MKHRNWLLKVALLVMSGALAAFGVLGWAYAARVFEAWQAGWGALDPLWPIFATAAIACVAAQVIAACAAVNFSRLAAAAPVWRNLAVAFYLVSVVFAAYSADRGAQAVMQAPQRAAFEAREAERHALEREIEVLAATIERERQRLPQDTTGVVAERQRAALAIFQAATAAATERLPEAQRALAERPPLPREAPMPALMSLVVFGIFLAWAVLEPWGYALAERGREPATPVAPASDAASGRRIGWLPRLVAGFGLWCVANTPPHAQAQAPLEPPQAEPVSISQWQDAKQVAFSLRDRLDVPDIAERVGRDKSTVYRWFREHDRAATATSQPARASRA